MNMKKIFVLTISMLLLAGAGARGEDLQWQSGFGLPGVYGQVYAFANYDDGSGEALFVGGSIRSIAGNAPATGVAKWTGRRWLPIAPLTRGGTVFALAVYDDGSGPKLYAGTTHGVVSAWNGTTWSELPRTGSLQSVQALAVFDDGSGPALYAGGSLNERNSPQGSHVVRWNGKTWSQVGTLNDYYGVLSLAVFDQGQGPRLIAGGWGFGDEKHRGLVSCWDGKTWTRVGQEMKGNVNRVVVYDEDGQGSVAPKLLAAGSFETVGDETVNHVAWWTGREWKALGSGVNFEVRALTILERPSGPVAVAGGSRVCDPASDDSTCPGAISEWNGKTWMRSRSAPNYVLALNTFDHGNGPVLYAGGQFGGVGDIVARGIAMRVDESWTSVGDENGLSNPVDALCTNGGRLYAAGSFDAAGVRYVHGVAAWDGHAWAPLGGGVKGRQAAPNVRTLLAHDGTIYAGGQFEMAGNVEAANIAVWTGSQWKPLGHGVEGAVWTMLWADQPGGSLYVGGGFRRAGDKEASCIARWDGREWHAVGTGFSKVQKPRVQLARSDCPEHPAPPLPPSLYVRALRTFDDGTGNDLYAGGMFDHAGDVEVNGIAKWKESAWAPLAGGVRLAGDPGEVHAMAVFDDGCGPALFVAGRFDQAGDTPAKNIARWNGSSWTPLGEGVEGMVKSLLVINSAQGAALYAAGLYNSEIRSWNGKEWTTAATVLGSVSAMAVFDQGESRSLCIGGFFSQVGQTVSFNFGCAPLSKP